MLVKFVQLGSNRCAGRPTMAESPGGQGQTPCTEAHCGPPEPPPNKRQYDGRRRFYTATWGAAKRRP
eukprot:1393919-Alexandrium_andersonii.AAC.1